MASPTANTGSLDLIDQTTSTKRRRSLEKRGLNTAVGRVCLSAAEIAVEAIAAAAAAFFTFGASEVAFAAEVAANVICWALAAAATIEAAVSHFLNSLLQYALQTPEIDRNVSGRLLLTLQ